MYFLSLGVKGLKPQKNLFETGLNIVNSMRENNFPTTTTVSGQKTYAKELEVDRVEVGGQLDFDLLRVLSKPAVTSLRGSAHSPTSIVGWKYVRLSTARLGQTNYAHHNWSQHTDLHNPSQNTLIIPSKRIYEATHQWEIGFNSSKTEPFLPLVTCCRHYGMPSKNATSKHAVIHVPLGPFVLGCTGIFTVVNYINFIQLHRWICEEGETLFLL